MLTRQDFVDSAINTIGNYPDLAPLYRMRDPVLMQHIEAIATMLALYSSQTEVALMEPYDKVRDGTVLADASMRGIIPASTPARVQLVVTNNGTAVHNIDVGRQLLDSNGLPWTLATPLDIQPGESATAEITQYRPVSYTHSVQDSRPFYAIEIPGSEDGAYLAGVALLDSDGIYEYRERFVNTEAGDRVFHIEADERQRIYVRMGIRDIVGVQPNDGDELTLQVSYSYGADASPSAESPFSVTYIANPADAYIEFKMQAMLLPGQNPMSMDVMRDLARYPATYDHNSVYQGEFEFLIRRKFPSLKFLSIWNEGKEEKARGAAVENINKLFVACVSALETEITSTDSALQVSDIQASSLTDAQVLIEQAILKADNSYGVRFYPAVLYPVSVVIEAQVSTNYLPGDVIQQIRDAVLSAYGNTSQASKRSAYPTRQDIYLLLGEKVQALKSGKSELLLSIGDIPSNRPELWVYISDESLNVSVTPINAIAPNWGY